MKILKQTSTTYRRMHLYNCNITYFLKEIIQIGLKELFQKVLLHMKGSAITFIEGGASVLESVKHVHFHTIKCRYLSTSRVVSSVSTAHIAM